MIDWSIIKREKFEQLAEVLIRRLYAASADEVIAFDGRGGDGGRDVLVVQGERRRIFQLKHFIDGFPSSNRSRRTQILKSFMKALNHKPTEWVLVYPGKLTPGEKDFIDSLPSSIEVARRLMDSTAMDDHLAAHPDIEISAYLSAESFTSNAMANFIEESRAPREVFDLLERSVRLQNLGDVLDPYWRVKPTEFRGQPVLSIEPKTDRSHIDSPISIKMSRSDAIGKASYDLADRVLGFGTNEELTLSSDHGWSIEMTGPAFLSPLQSNSKVGVTLLQREFAPPAGASITFRMLGPEDRLLSSHEGQFVHLGTGAQGTSFESLLHGILQLRVLMPTEPGGQLMLNIELMGASPTDVLGALEFIDDLQQCDEVEVYFDKRRFGRFQSGNQLDRPWPEAPAWKALADDLCVVQAFTRTKFGLPTDLSDLERAHLRFARMLLDGKCAAVPDGRVLNVKVKDGAQHELPDIFAGEACSIVVDGDFTLTLGHREMLLEGVRFFHPRVQASNAEEVLLSLRDASTSGLTELQLLPNEKEYYRAFMPGRLRSSNPDQTLVLESWGLPEIRDQDPSLLHR